MARQFDVQYVSFYTEGSAARKVAPVSPWKEAKIHKARRNPKIVLHIDPVAIMGMATAAVMLVMMIVGVVQLRQTQQQVAVMEAYVDTLREENTTLMSNYQKGYNLEDVETMALALGMVPNTEVRTVHMDVPVVEVEEPSSWEQVWIFLTGLFA
jgi:hypothetical protein